MTSDLFFHSSHLLLLSLTFFSSRFSPFLHPPPIFVLRQSQRFIHPSQAKSLSKGTEILEKGLSKENGFLIDHFGIINEIFATKKAEVVAAQIVRVSNQRRFDPNKGTKDSYVSLIMENLFTSMPSPEEGGEDEDSSADEEEEEEEGEGEGGGSTEDGPGSKLGWTFWVGQRSPPSVCPLLIFRRWLNNDN